MTSASIVLSLFYIRIADIYTLGIKTNLLKKNINFNSELIDILIWKELLVVKINMTTTFKKIISLEYSTFSFILLKREKLYSNKRILLTKSIAL